MGDAVHLLLFPLLLELLGHAGHHRHHEHVLRVDVVLLGPPVLDDRALHLVGALAAGQVGQQVAVVVLGVVDPAGGAARDHGQHAALGQPLEQLGALLHDGQVRAEVHVVHPLEAQAAHGRGHLAGDGGADGIAEFLAQRRAHRGSRLGDHMLAGLEGGVDLVDLAVLHQRAGGTDVHALAALDAGGIGKAAIFRRGHDGGEAAVLKAQDAQAVGVLAALHTTAAEYALAGVSHQAGSQAVHEGLGMLAGEGVIPRAGQLGHVQQLAVAVLVALLAVLVVVGQQQLHAVAAGVHRRGGADADLHALADGIDAAGHQAARAGGFDEAHAAGALVALAVVEGTQGRDLIAAGLGGFEDGQALLDLIGNALDFDVQHCLAPPYRFSMAPKRQTLMQEPHFAQALESIFQDVIL